MAGSKNKRKRLFVDKEVQSALARRIAFHWMVFVFVTFVLIGFLQTCVETPTLLPSEIFKTFIANNAMSLLIAFALLPVFVYDLIQVSNRFAGPMMRLRTALSDLAAGKPVKPLNFREGDFWGEVAENFNKAFDLEKKTDAESGADLEPEHVGK